MPLTPIDPYSQTEEAPQDIQPGSAEPTGFDPLSFTEPSGQIRLTEQPRKALPELRRWEKELGESFPSVYGALGATLNLLPYASYALPSHRDEFMELDQQDQTNALLHEALGATLWMFGGRVVKDVGYLFNQAVIRPTRAVFRGMKRVVGGGVKEATILPYEDALKGVTGIVGEHKGRPFSYTDEARRTLMGKGFAKDEAEAVASVLAGEDEGRLLDMVLERRYGGKEPTKAFNEAVKWQRGRLYPRPQLRKRILDEFGEDTIRSRFYNKQFGRVLMEDVYKAKPSKQTVEKIFQAHANRLFGEGAPVGFGEVTPHQMQNILYDMLTNKQMSWAIARPTLMASLKPARIVFGYGEKFLGTLRNVYEPIKGALGRTNQNYFNHSLLWAKMLEQRGAGKVVMKESGEFSFKRAKWLTPEVMDEAYKILRTMDDLTMKAGRAGEATLRDELMAQVDDVARGASNGAKNLIETWRSYSDHLYAEDMKMRIPRVFRKAGMTELGQNKIDEMMSGPLGLNYEIDMLFSTISQKNPTEKIRGVKELLKKARARLEYSGDVHPYFRAEGKDLDEVIKRATTQLTWGGGRVGFPKYLENYVARVSQHEDALMMKWKGGIGKEQSAFYTKVRQLERQKGEPVDFGQMVSARTMAHAKENFFYDKLDEVVRYSETLPPGWIDYIDGYLGGILNIPTKGDYKLANFFTSAIGSIERMMGREGLWSEQRVLNLAYSINNLTYLGGLGFKPFSAVRNLFQPLLTVPADMGGLKDLGKLVEGYRWALDPENRAYIRSLGAIAEYAPEIHLRPSILKTGKVVGGKELPTMEQVRDLGMWMFKASDRYNRYVTGGAAAIKWNRLVGKFGEPLDRAGVKNFSSKLGLSKRHPWKQAEIEDLLYRGKFAEAKGEFVKDIIADTQYLYGAAEAPTAIRKYGALGRTGFLFQSWWMNYGALLEKWMMTGSIGAKGERALTAFVAQSMAYMLMEPMWGKQTAVRSTFFGPFPKEFNEFMLPPSWSPVYHAVAAMTHIQTPEVSARHAKAFLDSSAILIPGGLQMKAFYRGAKEDDWEGFSRAILRLKKPER